MADAEDVLPGVLRVLAPNPSPLTLDGTNTWVVGGWIVDPGPRIDSHIAAVRKAVGRLDGVVLTHEHPDHAEAAPAFGGARVPAEGERVGPFTALATPGHSADSVCLLWERILFTGDTVLGEGSVFVAPGEGSLSAYLRSLERLLGLELDAICPGHGPVVHDPRAKLRQYLDHRRERERLIVDALEHGARSAGELLDRAWGDVDFSAAPLLRIGAAASLAAHLQKLGEEGRLPEGVEPQALAGPASTG